MKIGMVRSVWKMFSASRIMAPEAQGRLKVGEPVAIIDIGSNSVRLVVYEGAVRSPTPIFNEKVLCGLGKTVGTTRRLERDACPARPLRGRRNGYLPGLRIGPPNSSDKVSP